MLIAQPCPYPYPSPYPSPIQTEIPHHRSSSQQSVVGRYQCSSTRYLSLLLTWGLPHTKNSSSLEQPRTSSLPLTPCLHYPSSHQVNVTIHSSEWFPRDHLSRVWTAAMCRKATDRIKCPKSSSVLESNLFVEHGLNRNIREPSYYPPVNSHVFRHRDVFSWI